MPSRPGQSKVLLDELVASRDPVAVETAIARLAILGRPALRPVLTRLGEGDVTLQPRLLRVLERMGDPAALSAIRPLLTHDVLDVATAAVDAMGALLDAPDAAAATAALEALTATLLDSSRGDAVRLRAFEAIVAADRSPSYDADIVEPLRTRLLRDPSEAVRAAVTSLNEELTSVSGPQASLGESSLEAAAAGHLPSSPAPVRLALAGHGATVPLTVLHRLIERIRAHESGKPADEQEAWRVLRATAHQELAARGSRLGVYDLRETLEALGDRTPVGMLSALQQVGDVSVLDDVADAWQRTTNDWFRGQLVAIFRAVVAREKLTRRHAAARKLAARLPDAVAALWG